MVARCLWTGLFEAATVVEVSAFERIRLAGRLTLKEQVHGVDGNYSGRLAIGEHISAVFYYRREAPRYPGLQLVCWRKFFATQPMASCNSPVLSN